MSTHQRLRPEIQQFASRSDFTTTSLGPACHFRPKLVLDADCLNFGRTLPLALSGRISRQLALWRTYA